jgi:hypothetical protein
MPPIDEWTLDKDSPGTIRITAPQGFKKRLEEFEIVLEDVIRAMIPAIAAALSSRDDQTLVRTTQDLVEEIGRESEFESARFEAVVAELNARLHRSGQPSQVRDDEIERSRLHNDRGERYRDEEWKIEKDGPLTVRLRAPADLPDSPERAGVPLHLLLRALLSDVASVLSKPKARPVARSTSYLVDQTEHVMRSLVERRKGLLETVDKEVAATAETPAITRDSLVEFLRARGYSFGFFGGGGFGGGGAGRAWNHSHGIRSDWSHSHN